MKFIILAVVLLIVVIFFVTQKKITANPVKFYNANIDDIGYVYEALEKSGQEHSYAIFVFDSSEAMEGSHIELQFSKENGVVGFDWILLGPEKTRDQSKFESLAKENGYEVRSLEGNNVKYLRVESGDIVLLCKEIMVSMYKVSDEQKMELVAKDITIEKLDLVTE